MVRSNPGSVGGVRGFATIYKNQGNYYPAGSVILSKTMWTIKRRHQHIKAETLSEYLDGRIEGPALGRLDRQLADCDVCRGELESLQNTVTLLSELPVEAPGRSFTMAVPPPEPVRPRPSIPALVPQWAYAGAASVAAILLVVLVSADTTGLLSPDEPTAAPAVVMVTEAAQGGSQVSPEAAPALEAAAPVATEAPAASAENEDSQQSSIDLAAAEDASAEEEAAAVASMGAREAAAPIEPFEPSGPEPASKPVPPESQAQDSSLEAKALVPVEEPETRPAAIPKAKGTALFWRLLEGIAGALGLLFLAVFAFKWKMARRSGRA